MDELTEIADRLYAGPADGFTRGAQRGGHVRSTTRRWPRR